MTKGYWIPAIDVHNPEGYKAYMEATPEAHRKFGGRALVRGGTCEVAEGRARARHVLREFPDYATALACYRSPEYQRAKPLRLPHSTCDFVIIEGYDGPQPPQPFELSSPLPVPLAGEGGPQSRRGYWIAHVDVTDPKGHQAYVAANAMPLGTYGARFLVRGGLREVAEGKVRGRTIVLEFPSIAAARACYHSPEYQAAAALRKGKGETDLVIVEGCDGPPF